MKTLNTLVALTLSGALFGVTNTFAGDVPSQSIYDLVLVKPADAQWLLNQIHQGPKITPNGYCGALNMLMDETMWTIPMTHDAPQGNAGMFTAVGASDCP